LKKRRRRWLISAQRLERQRQPWVYEIRINYNPERVRQSPNPFRVERNLKSLPRVLASSNPGLKLANAFGVFKMARFVFGLSPLGKKTSLPANTWNTFHAVWVYLPDIMRYSILFILLVVAGCVVHDTRAQTPDLAVRYFASGEKKFAECDWVAAADNFTKAIQINARYKGIKSAKQGGNAFDDSQAEGSEISVSDTFTAHAYVNRGAARFYSGAFDQSIADYDRA
jgi:hypothetical protein